MRAPYTFEPLKSRFLYSFADQVYEAVHGAPSEGGAFDENEIFAELANSEKAARPHKITLLHDFIVQVCSLWMEPLAYDAFEHAIDYFIELFETTNLHRPRWLTIKKAGEHRSRLYKMASKAVEIMTPSIFFILYSDRQFLRDFQERLAEHVSEIECAGRSNTMTKDGVFRRVHIPAWLKQGVFYRDRGRCQHCNRDMTGWNRPVNDLHVDHIISLATGGTNDPTNFQLLCDKCNLSKGKTRLHTQPTFAPYW